VSNEPCKHETRGGEQFCIRCLREIGDRYMTALGEVRSEAGAALYMCTDDSAIKSLTEIVRICSEQLD
jgi:hypothetical protein